MAAIAASAFARTAATRLVSGIRRYKEASEYISIPMALGFGAAGLSSGFEHARKKGHGLARASACGVAHVPFFAFVGYGAGPLVIPLVTAFAVGTVAGVVEIETKTTDDKTKIGEKLHVKAGETNLTYTKTTLATKETEVE